MKKLVLALSLLLAGQLVHSQQAEKVVLLEMAHGTYCSPCFHSKEKLRQIALDYPGQVICAHFGEQVISSEQLVMNHDGTSAYMEYIPYTLFDIAYQSGVMVDRTTRPIEFSTFSGTGIEEIHSSYMAEMVDQQLLLEPPVGINISHTYNEVTRQLDAQVTVNFVDTANGDMGIYFFLTQDDVVAPGVDQLIGSVDEAFDYGYTYSDLDSIWGNSSGTYHYRIKNYKHPYVVKYIASGMWGNDGVISTSVSSGDSFSETFSYVLPDYTTLSPGFFGDEPPPVLPADIRIVAAVVKYGTAGNRQVLNAGTIHLLNGSATIVENELIESFSILSNPVNGDQLIVNFDASKIKDGALTIYNMTGMTVLNTEISQQGGTQQTIDISQLKAGTYICNYHSEGSNYTRKFTVL